MRTAGSEVSRLRLIAILAYLAGQRAAGGGSPQLPNPAEVDHLLSEVEEIERPVESSRKTAMG